MMPITTTYYVTADGDDAANDDVAAIHD